MLLEAFKMPMAIAFFGADAAKAIISSKSWKREKFKLLLQQIREETQ
jgi:hypothetical protein